jgi:hypothetical protein
MTETNEYVKCETVMCKVYKYCFWNDTADLHSTQTEESLQNSAKMQWLEDHQPAYKL